MSPPFHRRRWPYVVLGALVVLAALAGLTMGYFLRFDLPDVRALESYTPPVMSQVIDREGQTVATFAEERRMLVAYRDIPESFLQALIATEDSNFYDHTGVDFRGILRALWSDLRHLKLAQGASTLTQQLARNLFLHPEKTIRRKVQEVLLAVEIERQYAKQEILRFYCNQIYMGHGRYGLEAASRFYFGKPARDLSLVESAMAAGLIQRPEAISPFKNPARALERRNHVLRRMAEVGYLGAREAADAQMIPIQVSPTRPTKSLAPYFVEDVRRWLQGRFGGTTLYKAGFEVQTTLDSRLQGIANRAMETGLRELDKRQGWRGVSSRVPDDADEEWEPEGWEFGIEEGQVYPGVVAEVTRGGATVRVGPYEGSLGAAQIGWTKKKDPAELLEPGDLVEVQVVSIDSDEGRVSLLLDQQPAAQAALVALDPSTGAVRALLGGFDFERSEFNRATQAKRQTGSAFKPFVYAAALAQGWTLADTIVDEPTVFINPRNRQPYQPENYKKTYYETVTLRTAMEKSANIATVKLLRELGYQSVIDIAHALGIESELQPVPSLALGAFEVTLLELTSAYGTFANRGVHVAPHLVEEVRSRDGSTLERIEPTIQDAVSQETAYLVNRVLAGVITDGTGRAAASLKLNLAGKTGTTDNNTDAWFIGYAPNLAVGVWVGFDEPRSLGSRETGALAALPIWRAFMKEAFEGQDAQAWQDPEELTVVAIDRRTGLRANSSAGCDPVISEVFIRGTEPTKYCSENHHRQIEMPYPFQRYALSDEGELLIPGRDLSRLLDEELSVYLVDDGKAIEAHTLQGVVLLPLRRVPEGQTESLPSWLLERYDASEWRGRDGREARMVWMR